MARKGGRTQTCGEPQARQRLGHARSFLEVAELTADVSDPSLEYGSVAASVAILAGIAAADAACCQELGKRSRSENHHDAEVLLEKITPGGKRAASQLRQLTRNIPTMSDDFRKLLVLDQVEAKLIREQVACEDRVCSGVDRSL